MIPFVIVLIGLSTSYFLIDDLFYKIYVILMSSTFAGSIVLEKAAKRMLRQSYLNVSQSSMKFVKLLMCVSLVLLVAFSISTGFIIVRMFINVISAKDWIGLAIVALLSITLIHFEAMYFKSHFSVFRSIPNSFGRSENNRDF